MSEKWEAESMSSKGGRARAESLSKADRSEIARRAVQARWAKTLGADAPKATHEGTLTIGNVEIACAVLEDGRRVLTQETFLQAIGRSKKGKGGQAVSSPDGLPPFLAAESIKPFITSELRTATVAVRYRTPKGGMGIGFEATLLPKVCAAYLEARDAGATTRQQEHIVRTCDLLIRGLAHVGIIALVDEATGFQYARPRKELEEQLKKFLSDSLRRWVRTFPADYFKHLCRLKHVELRSDMKLPMYFGIFTNNLIYRRIAPGLLKKLQERRNERGKPSNKLHSWLSTDVGFPELLVHLGTVVGLMKLHTSYEAFEKQLNEIAPIYPEHPGLFDDPKDWESH